MSGGIAAQADEASNPINVKNLSLGWMIGFLFLVSFVGLFSIVPLRKMMILKYKLTYPSGTATAYLINSFHTPKGAKLAKKQVMMLFYSFCGSFTNALFHCLIFSFFTNKQHKCTQNLPPGKTGWPVIGETLDLILSGLKGHPERFLQERMRQHSSTIFRTSLFGSKKMVFFCGPSANKFLFSNEIKHVATWWPRSFNKVFLSATPADPSHTPDMIIMEELKRFRHLILGFLKLEALQNYIEIMDSVAKRHIEEEWAPKIDNLVVAQQAKLWRNLKIDLVMYLPGVMSLPLDFPGTALNRAIKNADFIRQDIVAIIKKRKMSLDEQQQNNNKDSWTTRDLLAHLLHTADENGKFMNEVEIADKIIGLLIAGYDTASSTLTFIFKYLAEYPHAYNEVFKDNANVRIR
ncbi:Beta-amyrin 28-monooxygenase [Camellia lanceoleosa]|uniref:Beta-amyrin 28-monooxygenase n=1 Tax=Camellia lanceoleosa TaxID=1840588 RepID=A0ACC0FEX2_9ERIC|nr:Beta-amyrin 28-monooxygenase [Camellia lanceoleosa]